MSLRNIRRLVFGLLFLTGTLVFQPSSARGAKSPAELIEDYGKRTVETLEDTDLTELENFEPLRRKLLNQLEPIIDFKLMTRSALGPAARSVSQEQLNRLTDVFRPLVVRLYSDRLLEYLAVKNPPWILDEIVVHGQEIKGGGSYALVKTTANVHRGTEKRDLSINFKLYKENDRWQVYDLVFVGVSMVENYRSQFSSVLANHSVDYLVEQLRNKLEQAREKSLQEKVEDGDGPSESDSGE